MFVGLLPFQIVGALVPYVLIRTGLSSRFKDKWLIVPQILWALVTCFVGYGLSPQLRAYALQLTCVILIFSMIDTKPRYIIVVGRAAISMLVLTFAVLLVARPAHFDPIPDGLVLAMTALIQWLLTLQSHNFATTRERVRQAQRELAMATDHIRELMIHDALTGMFNRQHMQNLLERECERHERSGRSFCVAIIDLDHFKAINDGHGHQVGDEVLVGLARTASAKLRETDVIARWGGEEFLVLLPEADSEVHGMRAVEHLREQVAAAHLCASMPELRVTFSAGIAVRQAGEAPANLLERADKALYRAKKAGRNRCMADQDLVSRQAADGDGDALATADEI